MKSIKGFTSISVVLLAAFIFTFGGFALAHAQGIGPDGPPIVDLEGYHSGWTSISGKTLYFPFAGTTQYLDDYYMDIRVTPSAAKVESTIYDADVLLPEIIYIPDGSWATWGEFQNPSVSGAGTHLVSATWVDDNRFGPNGEYEDDEVSWQSTDDTIVKTATFTIFEADFEPYMADWRDYLGVGETMTLYAWNTPGISGGTYSWECSSNLAFGNGQTTAQGVLVTIKPTGVSSSQDGDWVRMRYQTPNDDLGRAPFSDWVQENLTCIMDLDIENESETSEDDPGGTVLVTGDLELPYSFGPIPSGSYLELEVTSGIDYVDLWAYIPGYGSQWIGDSYQIAVASIPYNTELYVRGENAGSDAIVKLSILNGYNGTPLGWDTITVNVAN